MRETGGKLVTIEYDKARAQQATANIKKAGLSDVVQVISGDAFAEIPKVSGTFDFIFCDAWKRDYQKFFSMVFPRMDKGGLFLGHNVVNKKDEMGDFLKPFTRALPSDLDRLAQRRRNVGYPEALAIRSRRNTTSAPTRPQESRGKRRRFGRSAGPGPAAFASSRSPACQTISAATSALRLRH